MRLIDADTLLKNGIKVGYGMNDNGIVLIPMGDVRKSISNAPTIDAVPVMHGRWDITKEYNDVIDMDVVKYTCSVCKEYRLSATGLSQATNYCPNCGAKMDLK